MAKKAQKARQKNPKPAPAQPVFPEVFRIVGADLSLKRPGFCKITVNKTDDGLVFSEFETTNVNNKNKTKPHGQQLDEVQKAMAFFFPDEEKDGVPTYFVREKAALSTFSLAMIGQAKMAGMADWAQWRMHHEWAELAPNAIKKLVTGNGKAEKEEVARCMESYIGERKYACDDESDAAAVAIGYLIHCGLIKPAFPVQTPETKEQKE